jgi:hypothetical protein
MKFKFPILIATALLIVSVSKAQYGSGYVDNRVNIHGRIIIPGRTAYQARYDNRRDWRADEYERFCREHRGYRGGREAYYRDHWSYRPEPFCAPRRVVVYGY